MIQNQILQQIVQGKILPAKSPSETNAGQNKDSSIVKNEETTLIETLPAWKNINGKLYYVTEKGTVQKKGGLREDEIPEFT